MPNYRIYRLRAHLKQSFRSAPHVSGVASVKPRDYDIQDEQVQMVEADTPYAAYFAMKETAEPLEPGDLLEVEGTLRIYKYVGFEEAKWVLPEPKLAEAAGEPGAGVGTEDAVLASNNAV
jgi:hypothetical protein